MPTSASLFLFQNTFLHHPPLESFVWEAHMLSHINRLAKQKFACRNVFPLKQVYMYALHLLAHVPACAVNPERCMFIFLHQSTVGYSQFLKTIPHSTLNVRKKTLCSWWQKLKYSSTLEHSKSNANIDFWLNKFHLLSHLSLWTEPILWLTQNYKNQKMLLVCIHRKRMHFCSHASKYDWDTLESNSMRC